MKLRNVYIAVIVIIGISITSIGIYNLFFTKMKGNEFRSSVSLMELYDITDELLEIAEKFTRDPGKAVVVMPKQHVKEKTIVLTFDGLTEPAVMERILLLLEKHKVRATFFVDAVGVADEPKTLLAIKDAAFDIESYTLYGRTKMETLPFNTLLKDFVLTQKIIDTNSNYTPKFVKCNDTNYTDDLLRLAKACGMTGVVVHDHMVDVKQLNKLPDADSMVGMLQSGDVVAVKLKQTDDIVMQERVTDLRPAIDKKPGLKKLHRPDTDEKIDVVDALEKLLVSLQKAGYNVVSVEDVLKPSANLPTAIRK